MLNRTAVPTAEQRKDIGRKAAISLGLTVADIASRSNVTDEAGLYDLITHQASSRTWDQILSASWDDVASAGIPGTVLDAGVRKGFSRETVGRLVQEAAQQVFEAEPATEPIPDGTLVEWTGIEHYGTNLSAGDLVRVVSGRASHDTLSPNVYSITGRGDNAPDHAAAFTVRDQHIKRPTITSGDGRLAFTITSDVYGGNIPLGTKVEVISGPDHDGDFYCRETQGSRRICYYKAAGLEPWTPARQAFEDAEADTAKVAEMTEQVVESQPEVLALQREVESLRQQVADLNRWRSQALSDMSTASERLIEESERRNWCSEYDQIIDDINGRMNVLGFDVREQEVDCEAEVEAEVTVELNGYQLSGTITMNISYTGSPTEDPSDADYITDGTVEQYAAEALGVSYRYVSVDSWCVESYEAS
jgi:hypothetical protein